MASDNVVIQAILEFKDRLTAPMKKAEKSLAEIKEEIKQVNQEMSRFRLDALKKKLEALKSGKATGGLLDITKSLQGMGRLVIGANIVQGFAQMGAAAFTAGEEVRKGALALETITGSAENAAAAMSTVQDVAMLTGSTISDTTNAYIAMANRGIAPTADTLKAFANVAAGSNKSMIQFTEAVADAVTGEYERLKEFGIKVAKDGDKLNVSFKGQSKQIGNSAAEIEQYLTNLGKVDFAGAAEKQTKTVSAQLSILGQNFVKAVSGPNAFYDSIVEGLAFVNENFQGFVDEIAANVDSFISFFTDDIPGALNSLLSVTGQDLNSIGEYWSKFWDDNLSGVSTWVQSLWGMRTDTRQWGIALVIGLADLGISINGIFTKIATYVNYTWDMMIYGIKKSMNGLIGYLNRLGDSDLLKKFNLGFKVDEIDAAAPKKLAAQLIELDKKIQRERELNERVGAAWSEDVAARHRQRIQEMEDERAQLKKKANELAKTQAAEAEANNKTAASISKVKDAYEEAANAYKLNEEKLVSVKKALSKLQQAEWSGEMPREKYASMRADLMKQDFELQRALNAGADTFESLTKTLSIEADQVTSQIAIYEKVIKSLEITVREGTSALNRARKELAADPTNASLQMKENVLNNSLIKDKTNLFSLGQKYSQLMETVSVYKAKLIDLKVENRKNLEGVRQASEQLDRLNANFKNGKISAEEYTAQLQDTLDVYNSFSNIKTPDVINDTIIKFKEQEAAITAAKKALEFFNSEQAKAAYGAKDQAKYINEAKTRLKEYEEAAKNTNDEVGEHFKEGARSIQSAISDALFDTLEGRAVNFGRTLVSIFNRIASEILASTVFQALLGDYGSGSSQVGGFFGSLFGGARAAGGPVNSNKAYLVGEKGPELFVPKSNGSIMPNSSFGAGERPVYVTIQAVDTQSFQDALSRNSRWLTDMVNGTSRRYNLGR